jgi:RNA polymerase sigma factor (sigma-70 family)
MDATSPPLEPVEAERRPIAARADTVVVTAFTEHHEELYAFLVRLTRDPEAAADLLQETFLRLTVEVRAGRTPEQVRPWLYRVAANLATSRGRRIRSALRWFDATVARVRAAAPADPPESEVIAGESHHELMAALAHLGPDARTALLLSAEGFSGSEIAAIIGRTDGATRTLLCRSRLAVRSHLASAEVVP